MTGLEQRETLARIDRAIEETAKFSAETRKLLAEATKFRREPWIAAIAAGAAMASALTLTLSRLH